VSRRNNLLRDIKMAGEAKGVEILADEIVSKFVGKSADFKAAAKTELLQAEEEALKNLNKVLVEGGDDAARSLYSTFGLSGDGFEIKGRDFGGNLKVLSESKKFKAQIAILDAIPNAKAKLAHISQNVTSIQLEELVTKTQTYAELKGFPQLAAETKTVKVNGRTAKDYVKAMASEASALAVTLLKNPIVAFSLFMVLWGQNPFDILKMFVNAASDIAQSFIASLAAMGEAIGVAAVSPLSQGAKIGIIIASVGAGIAIIVVAGVYGSKAAKEAKIKKKADG
jgi:hypothetical protein